MGEEAGRLLRSPTTPQRATFLELFLDLVFVFALTRISARLIEDLTGDGALTGVGQSLLLFLALWVVWVRTVWSTSWLEPETRVIQSVVVVTVIGAMVMAVSVPDGFGERAGLFAITLVTLQIGRIVYFQIVGHGGPDPQQAVRNLFWLGLAAPLWIVGGLVEQGTVRGALWTVAIVVDCAGLLLGWPTPGLGAHRVRIAATAAEHLTERYQQFLLISLGEAIFVVGLALSGSAFHAAQTAGFALGLTSTILLWRIYFHRAGRLLGPAISRSTDTPRLATEVAFTHLVMIAGIVLTGAGFELIITAPLAGFRATGLVAILGGPALFLTGRLAVEFQIFSRVSQSHTVGILALGVLAPATLQMPPLAAGTAVVLVLLGVAAADTRSHGRSRDEPTPPI